MTNPTKSTINSTFNSITIFPIKRFSINTTKSMRSTWKQHEESIRLSSITKISNKTERNLTKTEFTIIITCILFITLLTFINLIIYAIRKLIKKKYANKNINDLNSTDPSKKSYDILPGVGEIVLWAANDKRGYLIDINGSWAKIDGQRWLRENMAVIHNTYKKASTAYRKRFKKKDEKKQHKVEDILSKNPSGASTICSSILDQSSSSSFSNNFSIQQATTNEEDEEIQIESAQTSSTNTLSENDIKTNCYSESILSANQAATAAAGVGITPIKSKNITKKFKKSCDQTTTSSSSDFKYEIESNYYQMTNDTFKVTSEFEEFIKNQKNNYQSIFSNLNNTSDNTIDFTKIISDTLSLDKHHNEFFDIDDIKKSPKLPIVSVHSDKDCIYTTSKKENTTNKIPTLYFTSSSGSIASQSDTLKLRLANNNTFSKPILKTSTENNDKQEIKNPSEYLNMDNYCVKKPESMNTTTTTTTTTTTNSLFKKDDFDKYNESNSSLTNTSMIPVLYQDTSNKRDNTFSFKFKQIKEGENLTDQILPLFDDIENDLRILEEKNRDLFVKEFQEKSVEKSKNNSRILDEHGNLVKNLFETNKLASRDSINSQIEFNDSKIECKFEIKSVQLGNLTDLQQNVLSSKIPVKSSSNNNSNNNMSKTVGRSMLTEAKAKLETFSKMSKSLDKKKENQTKF